MWKNKTYTSIFSLTGVLAMGSSIFTTTANAERRWEDQAVFRVNKEAAHATKMPFPTEAGALSKTRMESPWCLLLNGEWKFHWSPTVEEHEQAAGNFFSTEFSDADWGTIPVPSNVELHGHGTPLYSNATYPFVKNPPSVTDEPPADWTSYKERSPVSAYRRTFTLPADWDGRQTFIIFNGVQSAFTLYVNGQEIGYSQDSRTPAEFNITQAVHAGENLVAVEVHRWSDGSYLEDQDFWRLSGIFRDVYLWSSDQLALRDIEIKATLDETYEKGVLDLKTWVYNHQPGDTRKYSIETALLDAEGNTLAEKTLSGNVFAETDHIANAQVADLAIKPWSAEVPNLYTLKLVLKDQEGQALAYYAFDVGFRTTEIKDGNLLINGKPILIKGVNRHDHDHLTGHYIPEETMRAELDLMKRLNINAIRTSHYPNDPRFLELVNEYGFYVISEANVETHAFGCDEKNMIANTPAWRQPLLDRVKNMVETFKNQPCIIAWSLGNEAGTGPNFQGNALWVHGRDPSRPLHYEGARDAPDVYGMPYDYVDFESPMYYPISRLDGWCRTMEKLPPERQKPLIQCEYSHAMGNSCGGLDEYWELIRKEPLLQGGFIWDWRDQGLLQTKPANPELLAAVTVLDKERFVAEDGSIRYFAYGGDFGDKPNDDNFCMNGVVGADLVPNPHATEVAYQYRSILTSGVVLTNAQPVVKVFNENFFTTLKDQPMKWALLQNGKEVLTGEMTLPELAPQTAAEITIPLPNGNINEAAEYHLNVEYPLSRDAGWADPDFIIARDQLALGWTQPQARLHESSKAALPPRTMGNTYVLTAGSVNATIDKTTGQLVSYKMGRFEFLRQPLQLNFWRAATDNDRGAKLRVGDENMPLLTVVEPWREAGAKAKVVNVSEQEKDGTYEITFDLDIPVGETKAQVIYTFYGDGNLQIALSMTAAGEEVPSVIPRVGFQCALAPTLSEWSWFGRGPEENYSDRNDSTFVGSWNGNVRELWFPYAEPQQTANRTDVRQARFQVGDHGLLIRPTDGQLLEIDAYPFLMSDLETGKHPGDLPLRDLITVDIGLRQMGVGGENSWGAMPRPDHLLPTGETAYEYAFLLQPF